MPGRLLFEIGNDGLGGSGICEGSVGHARILLISMTAIRKAAMREG